MTSSPRVAVFPTCVVDTIAPEVGVATVRVLRSRGCEVTVPRDATCCGQPAWNAGFAAEAATVARATLRALATAIASGEADAICVPAGSCATMMRVFWPELFHTIGDAEAQAAAEQLGPAIKEFSELVDEIDQRDGAEPRGPAANSTTSPKAVAYHHSCHMLRELHLAGPPVRLLDAAGADVVEWEASERCCGFGGLFSVKQPELSVAMADDKLDSLAAVGATTVVGCDSSCLLHLRARSEKREQPVRIRHLAEVLADQLPNSRKP